MKWVLALAVLLLLGSAWTGFSGGVDQLPQSVTAGELAQTWSQFAYGLFALLSVATTFRATRWNRLGARAIT